MDSPTKRFREVEDSMIMASSTLSSSLSSPDLKRSKTTGNDQMLSNLFTGLFMG